MAFTTARYGVIALSVLCMGLGGVTAQANAAPMPGMAPSRPATSDRIDNLRLQRIANGPMRGQLVVAGSLDHLPAEDTPRDVVVRMAMKAPDRDGGWRSIGRKVLTYRLPAKVSPQDLTLRWLLSERQSRQVRHAGDAARLRVSVRESRAGGTASVIGSVADQLRVEPLTAPPDYTTSPRSTITFIPGGYYSSDADATFYLWTAEDETGAPYVGGAGYSGSAGMSYLDYWVLDPLWMLQGAASGSPGPGGGYVYLDGSVPSWSMSTVMDAYCTLTVSISGTFSGPSNAAMSWPDIGCNVVTYVPGGSVSLTVMD